MMYFTHVVFRQVTCCYVMLCYVTLRYITLRYVTFHASLFLHIIFARSRHVVYLLEFKCAISGPVYHILLT